MPSILPSPNVWDEVTGAIAIVSSLSPVQRAYWSSRLTDQRERLTAALKAMDPTERGAVEYVLDQHLHAVVSSFLQAVAEKR
ncbi:MAG TPA: hypothetical protein VGN72_09520 [Tepidisphaeraceae bacterium]|nr:hypothetical protein [Tepidisphaeraceae bacterium]